MNKKFLFAGLLILILIVVGIYFIYDSSTKMIDPWNGIPKNAGIVIEIDKPYDFFENLSKNEIWESVRLNENSSKLNNTIVLIDSIRTDLFSESVFDDYPIVFSIHPNPKSGELNTLLISTGHSETSLTRLKNILEYKPGIEFTSRNETIQKISLNQNRTLFIAYINGLILCSETEDIVRQSLQNINSEESPFKENPALELLKSYSGSNVDARLFIQYQYLSAILKTFGDKDYNKSLAWLGDFCDWTETDVLLKKDEIIMTGFTIQDNSKNTFLSFFQNQEAVEHKVFNLLPFNTNMLLSIGRQSFTGYPASKSISEINQKLNVKADELFDLIQGEIVLASNGSNASNNWFFIQSNQKNKIKSFLDKLANKTGSGDVENYTNYKIGKINYKGLIPDIFGQAFSAIQNNYYTFIGEFAVFANSREALINLIRMYETGKTLDLNENFKAFSDNIGQSSNILFYVKPYEVKSLASKYLNSETAKTIQDNKNLVRSLHGLSFQFNGGEDFFYTSIYLKGSKSNKEENLASWKLNLDDIIVGKPSLVKDHKTGTFNLVVFDQSKNMYLVSTDGQIMWKKRIDALPESDIYEVDYYKNRKIQYLFNTRDFIYLIDKNGENVANYPRKLNPSATNGLNLFDYNKKRDYRLMLALSDKRIYNYKLDGKQVKGWVKPRTNDLVINPVQRLVANKKDYIIINDANNDLSIVNRKGNTRIKLKQYPEKAKYSLFYINKTNSKGIILSTDVKGKLFYISADGNINYTDFGEYSPSHFFLYEDFNGDGAVDFIYVDGNDLKVFDRFKNVLFSYQFDSPISIKPEFFKLSGKARVLGIVANKEKTIYLFDNKGNTLISKGLIGETPFTVGNLENNKDVNLITAAGSTLFNYRID